MYYICTHAEISRVRVCVLYYIIHIYTYIHDISNTIVVCVRAHSVLHHVVLNYFNDNILNIIFFTKFTIRKSKIETK